LPLVLAGLAGCGGSVADNAPAAPEAPVTRLGDKIDVSLADWLRLSRAELAQRADEWAVTVEKQQEFSRTNSDSVDLLPQLHAPVVVPVFASCRYSPAAGFSLPPYLKEGTHDPAVALHLARAGDHEAALKLADPADADLRSQIDAWRGDRNYPLEWTRLVSLVLQSAQFKMARGAPEGATELVLLHRQLREVLDGRAAKGPLGAALLPVGRQALALAARAWREPKQNKKALAEDVEAALAAWGELPAPVFGLRPHAGRADLASLFGRPAEGRAATATAPAGVQRALDLLAVPLTQEGAQAVVAFLDARDRFDDVVVVYRPRINEHYPLPADLGYQLVEHGFAGDEPVAGVGLRRQVYAGGGLAYDLTVFTRGRAGGALVRVGSPQEEGKEPPAVFARNPRDFGALSLDRSFTANRLALAPQSGGDTVQVESPDALKKVSTPVADHPLESATLQREPGRDLLASLTLLWPTNTGNDALVRLAVPLWEAYGRSRVEGAEDEHGGYLGLTWEGGTTRLKLRLSYDAQPPELVAADDRGPGGLATRALSSRKLDLDERQARLAAGTPLRRLRRWLQVNGPATGGPQADGLQLGQPRAEALGCLPGSAGVRRHSISDGVSLLFTGEAPRGSTYWARQMFVRFGPDDRVAEVRVRYQDGPEPPSARVPGLLDTLKKIAGAPEELPGPWAGLWSDLAPGKKPVLYRWHDDATELTYQRDEGGMEVILRNRPANSEELAPLQFCGRGIDLCALGDARAEVLKKAGVDNPPTAANGAEVLRAPASSPYDLLLVWYDHGRVSRIIARHRTTAPLTAADVGTALQQAWAQNLDRLGVVRRQEGPRGPVLGAYDWHDDVTRVRTFAQDTEEGVRLFTEYRDWPGAAKSVAQAPR
jgi:hypothetical protein